MKTIKVLFTTTSVLALVLSLLLASCGGSDKDSDSSGSGDKKNPSDKEGPASAPTATGPENPVGGASYDLPIVCNEPKEVVSITGKGLEPDPQTHTCAGSGAENFSLSLKQGVKFISPNNLTLSSMDEHGNSADKITMVDVPIDTLALSIESAPMGTSLNAASYPVSGNCDVGQGDVTVTVETASPAMATCTGDPAGAYTALLDISGVTADPMSVTVEQNGNTKSLSPSPGNDQNGPASAPTATGPGSGSSNAISTLSYNLPIVCSEVGEVVSITGNGLEPDPQTHTCAGSGAENFQLSIEGGENFSSSNNLLTLSSMDQYGNTADVTTTVDVPIDTSAILPTVSIDSLPNVDASNAQSFTVEGTCSQEGEPVMVSVGGISPETDPDCTSGGASGGVWTVDLDVTSLNGASIAITADHSSSSGVDATQASQSVTNSFICPANFVAVPSLQDYTTNSFCVMKYEAKKDASNNAVSQAASLPYTDINRDDSITKCKDIGSGYDLITNDEWQSIARNIELVGSNWKNGTVGDAGGLSTGHSDQTPAGALAANSDDNNACHETEATPCDGSTWNSQRRTHTLSNGEVVWDISGNVGEWVKDNNTTKYGSNTLISRMTNVTHSTSGSLSGGTTTTSRTAKGQFGPSGDYTSLNPDPPGWLGYGHVNFNVGGVLRGGANWDIIGTIGVFSVNLGSSVSSTHASFGFRCVHHP